MHKYRNTLKIELGIFSFEYSYTEIQIRPLVIPLPHENSRS